MKTMNTPAADLRGAILEGAEVRFMVTEVAS